MAAYQQQQLALLEDAMKSRKEIETVTEDTNNLKERLFLHNSVLNDLQKISLATATLLGSVDNSSPQTEMSSLQILSKLEKSKSMNPKNGDKEDMTEVDQSKMIVGKYLNQILAVLIAFTEEHHGNLNIISLMQIENKISQLFDFAEQKEIVPVTEDGKGWKKGVQVHLELFEKINEALEHGGDDPDEEQQ